MVTIVEFARPFRSYFSFRTPPEKIPPLARRFGAARTLIGGERNTWPPPQNSATQRRCREAPADAVPWAISVNQTPSSVRWSTRRTGIRARVSATSRA